ncbi:MAG: SprT-like domain-containing protein [Bacteroidota bacterium]
MSKYLNIFQRFVPESSAAYCLKLYEHFGFEFKIKKSRQTKLGDYRYDFTEKKHIITINNDLNPYAFLLTYLHEVAHLVTFDEHKNKVSPHGTEWKNAFKKVSQPVLNEEIFPPMVLHAIQNYFKNPKASSCSDPTLYNVLRKFDHPSDTVPLKSLNIGDKFDFNGRIFQKKEIKRTRAVCLEIATGRKYLINEIASVKIVD